MSNYLQIISDIQADRAEREKQDLRRILEWTEERLARSIQFSDELRAQLEDKAKAEAEAKSQPSSVLPPKNRAEAIMMWAYAQNELDLSGRFNIREGDEMTTSLLARTVPYRLDWPEFTDQERDVVEGICRGIQSRPDRPSP